MARKSKKVEEKGVEVKYKYLCPACSNEAIYTSNKMLGVEVDCLTCGKRIQLDDAKRYLKI